METFHFKGNQNTTAAERIYNAISGTTPRTDAPKTSLGRITEALNNANQSINK